MHIPTPAIVIDAEIVRRNIRRLADYAGDTGLQFRPHTKTHKSQRVARMQLEHGAIGLTVAKVGEMAVMAPECDDLLIAYPPIDGERAKQLATFANGRTIRAAIDSAHALALASDAANVAKSTIGLLVDLDVGLGRTGVQSPQDALALAIAIDATPGVRLDGLLVYPGNIWDAANEQRAKLASVSALIRETLDLWRRDGLDANIVSGGSTPTAYQSHLIPELTEIRPGTYVFNDMNTARGGFCELDDCAARVVTTVISTAVPGQVVIDAGSKTLTSDRCVSAPESGHGHVIEYPDAKITKLSEEHGQIDVSECDRAPKVGDRISIIPNHICPCVNLHETVWWKEPHEPPERTPIDARGRTT